MKRSIDGHPTHIGTGDRPHRHGGKAVLFIHGAGFDHSVWTMPARFFARHGFDVMAPDLPGHGRSAGAPLERIEDMAGWLEMLMDELEQPVAVAIGHSMGSLVATELAHKGGDRIARVALLGTSQPMPVGAPLLDAARDDHPAAFAMANTWSHSAQGRLGAARNPGLSNFVSGARWLERLRQGVYFADLNACNDYAGRSAPLHCPVLVVVGAQDKMTSPKAGQAVAELHQARRVVLDGCGHSMLSERPNEVLDALAAFVLREEEGSS